LRIRRRALPRLRAGAPRDLGDAVLAHRDAVEDVCRLHRALPVRDDDELRTVGGGELDEAADVRVAERRPTSSRR
jgi:hypothetical protein